MQYALRSLSTGQVMYVGDGIFSSFGNFLNKTIVGKLVSGAVSLAPGGSKVVGAIKKGTGFLAKTFESRGAQAGAAAAGGAVVGGTAIALSGAGGGAPALPVPYAGGTAVGSAYAGGGMLPEVLDPASLRTYYRAPKGFVIVRDRATGQIAVVRKDVARRAHLWTPARKPPISAGDWHRYQTARSVEKKLLKIARHALRRHGGNRGGVGIIQRGAADKIVRFRKAS